MTEAAQLARQLRIAAVLAGRGLRRRLRGADARPTNHRDFCANFEPWLARLPDDACRSHHLLWLSARQPPWLDTGIDLEPGDRVSLFADGRVYLSRALDIWVGPAFQLWCRVGTAGPVFRGTRNTHSFVATNAGRLSLASYFPGEWADQAGALRTSPADYASVNGGLSVLVVHWNAMTELAALIRQLAADTSVPALVLAEIDRLDQSVPTPSHWEYLWYVGPGEIYRAATTEDGRPSIQCCTRGDVGILRRDATCPLRPGTRLDWHWKVDTLPSDLEEDTLPSHDYLSIAVEFDDGQDITYYWSAALPVGTVYRCPLPTWKDKETHVVVRSGTTELGQWLAESRDLFEDYSRIIGGPASSVVRVWLIANSLFQRQEGRCEFARIRLTGKVREVEVL